MADEEAGSSNQNNHQAATTIIPRHMARRISNKRPPIQQWPYAYLLLPPILLAFLTASLLFVHSDVNIALLYSQCHARARIPFLSHIPVIGAPVCFLVSFFREAIASTRSFGVLAGVLSSIGGLLTVCLVEAARVCNAPAVLIAYPTGPWLVFNLIGGAVVWELVIIPAFFHRSQQILAIKAAPNGDHAADGDEAESPDVEPSPAAGPNDSGRHLRVVAEVVAIPVAVAIGFVLPSVLMLVLDSPIVILIWLFFPIYVSLIRTGLRKAILRLPTSGSGPGADFFRRTLHLESHTPSLLAVYALPVLCSVVSHVCFVWTVFQPDDRKEMTRAAVTFIEIDAVFIALTVLYWIAVEAGLEVAAVTLAFSILFGPGAGICVGWYLREQAFGPAAAAPEMTAPGDDEAGDAGERTPLLR